MAAGYASSHMFRPITASKEFINTEESRARYLDFVGFHRARAYGKTLHDDELKDIHEIDSETQAAALAKEDNGLIRTPDTPSDEANLDRAIWSIRRVRLLPDASDAEDLLRFRLRNIYSTIRRTGREVAQASTYYTNSIAPSASQTTDTKPGSAPRASVMDVVENALSRDRKTKKGAAFERLIAEQEQIAEWRYDAMVSEIRHRRDAFTRKRESHTGTFLLDSDVDFIVMADLAVYLYLNRSTLSMAEIEELWQILVKDVDAKVPYKLTFEQFEMWLLEHHPKLRKMKRFVLISFATDDSFENAFALEDALLERRDEVRKRRNAARNKMTCCGYVCVSPIG